ncbi:MAG TPA: hypothetical protein VG165_17295 [Solirubrobacteraceae bacterium]|jgi:hypothetical protein|nr:hypothetical protein [Solirubrobacteraceae bacterium]
MNPAAVVTILIVLVIVLALVVYLLAIIVELRTITADLNVVNAAVVTLVRQTVPVNDVVTTINRQLDAGVDLLEGLLVKKAGMTDAIGLVEGLYPAAAPKSFRKQGRPKGSVPRIGEVYTRGTLILARLGREAPIAAGNPAGVAIRDVRYASASSRLLYPDPRRETGSSRDNLPRTPVIGRDSPHQYEVKEEAYKPRKRMSADAVAPGPPPVRAPTRGPGIFGAKADPTPPPAAEPEAPEDTSGRSSAMGLRPWER